MFLHVGLLFICMVQYTNVFIPIIYIDTVHVLKYVCGVNYIYMYVYLHKMGLCKQTGVQTETFYSNYKFYPYLPTQHLIF